MSKTTLVGNQAVFTDVNLIRKFQGDVENNLNAFDFGERVLALMTDPRFLNVMCEDPTATYIDISGKGHIGTYQGTWTSGDRLKQGRNWVLDPNGTDAYIDLGDSDDFSFGNGNNDCPVTFCGMIEVLNISGFRRIITKYDYATPLQEWLVSLNSSEQLYLSIFDNSLNKFCMKRTNLALSIGKHSFVITYSGIGGGTAANGIAIYIDGVLVASTSINDASYVAMENLGLSVLIGANKGMGGTPESFIQGDFGCLGIDAVEWSATDSWRFHQLCLSAYSEDGVSL